MNEGVLFPSPNWFQVSVIGVSPDGWIVYGGPSKSLCVLEPLPYSSEQILEGQSYQPHVINRAHTEKIVSVDISPNWLEQKTVLTGSADGHVKQWSLTREDNVLKIKSTHSHEVHANEKEELVGVGYSNEVFAITLGGFKNIVKWDTNSNVTKAYSNFMKNFKPICMSCSHHTLLNVAIGTKQGVVFVLDLNGAGKIVYKVRAHDEEILNLSWCPQYKVEVKKLLKEPTSTNRTSSLASRLERIRNEPEPEEDEMFLPEKKPTAQKEADAKPDTTKEESLNETEIVQEDDMFDIYKDHEADEFGHKKYQPETEYLNAEKQEAKPVDFLAECLRLKQDILKKKDEEPPTIASLVDALDSVHVSGEVREAADELGTLHTHRHLLATVSKSGSVRTWSKTGKLVASAAVAAHSGHGPRRAPGWLSVLWLAPETLLVADAKCQLLECNPLVVDGKNKLECRVLHSHHRRGLYAISSPAPRVQAGTSAHDWPVFTAAQDRDVVHYSLRTRQVVQVLPTCGGFVYCVAPCPYDATRLAIAAGDGALRVWQTGVDEGERLARGLLLNYWQHVRGKVLCAAWHPRREGRLAFATAEGRVGVVDLVRGAARALPPAPGGVYALCWGEAPGALFASAGALLLYDADKPDEEPKQIPVEFEGAAWRVSEVSAMPEGSAGAGALLVGGACGGVAVLRARPPYDVLAAAFPFAKTIHSLEAHPAQVSGAAGASPHRGVLAAASLDKRHLVALLRHETADDGTTTLTVWKTLSGHREPVVRATWSPHREGTLLSASYDGTLRIWDIVSGACTSIFPAHGDTTLGAAWAPAGAGAGAEGAAGAGAVLSGGADCTLRLWRPEAYPADAYVEPPAPSKKKKKHQSANKEKPTQSAPDAEELSSNEEDNPATNADTKPKVSKRYLLPTTQRQLVSNSLEGCMYLLKKREDAAAAPPENCAFVKMFGSINDVNELLDAELSQHAARGAHEAYVSLCLLRGAAADAVTYAARRDALSPLLLALSPQLSHKYWKDVTQLYIAQLDRLVAKGEEEKPFEHQSYGGPALRRAAALLAVHEARAAAAALADAALYKEAYLLCRVRYMDSIAEEMLRAWAAHSLACGALPTAALCYLALDDPSQAALALGRSQDEAQLAAAAAAARAAGRGAYAAGLDERARQENNQEPADQEEDLEQLPTRMELLMMEHLQLQEQRAGADEDEA